MQDPSNAEDRKGAFHIIRSVIEKLQSEFATRVVLVVVASIGGVLTFSWSSLKNLGGSIINDQMIRAVDSDLKSEKSKLAPTIEHLLTQRMLNKSSDIGTVIDIILNSGIKENSENKSGALAFGAIFLDKNNPTTTIHIIDPPSHSGQLFIKAVHKSCRSP